MDASWNFSLNNTVSDSSTLALQSQSILFQLKVSLLSAGWTVISSSNGTTFNTTDLWTVYTGLVQGATTSTARSWILLASPVGHVAGPAGTFAGTQSKMYLIIDYQGASANSARFIFGNGSTSGGSTTAVPTITNQSAVVSQFSNGSATALLKWNFMYMPANGGFIFLCSLPSTNYISGMIYSLPLIDTQNYSGLAYPYSITQGAYFNQVTTDAGTIFQNGLTWGYDGLISSTTNGYLSYTTSGIDINYKYEASPIYIGIQQSGKSICLGKIPDVYRGNWSQAPSGSTFPLGNTQYSSVYNMLLPANVSIIN